MSSPAEITTRVADKMSQYDFLKDLPWLQQSVFGNSVYSYMLACATFVASFMLFYLLRAWVGLRISRRESTPHPLLLTLIKLLQSIKPPIIFIVALYTGLKRLTLPDNVDATLNYLVLISVTIQFVILLGRLATIIVDRTHLDSRPVSAAQRSTAKNLTIVLKMFLWVGGALFLLDNFGINVSTFVTGIGIGGIAVALAAQAILGDAFSSFTIALDKPFEVGDFVMIDDMQGTVEHVGLKTTRVRSLSGELLVFGNSDLTSSRIRNYKKMRERRIEFQIGFVYGTTVDQLKKIPEWIQQCIDGVEGTRFDRAHFACFGDFALLFHVVYYVQSPEYPDYMDAQQAINLGLAELCERTGLEMAFPTQTVHVKANHSEASTAPLC